MAVVVTWTWNDDPWHPQPHYESYDVASGAQEHAKVSPGAVADGACGFRFFRAGNRSVILDLVTKNTPAAGVQEARRAVTLRAIDAETMAVLWSTQVLEGTNEEVPLCNPAGFGVSGAYVIKDGRFVVFASLVIDVMTGKGRPIEGEYSAVGDWVVLNKGDQTIFTDPASGATVGTLSGRWRFSSGTEFGAGVFVSRGPNTSALAGYSLPSGAVKWQTSYDPTSRYIQYDPTTNAFVFSDREYGDDAVLAVSAVDGHVLWGPIDTSGVCGVDKGRVVVSVNGQLAVLDVSDGSQLSYDPTTSVCPTIIPGIQLIKAGSGYTVKLF